MNIDIAAVIDERAVTRWLSRMNAPASLRGHKYQAEGTSRWCECGMYLGGLGLGDDASDCATWKQRHELHLVCVKNAQR